jgi:hypothetical protein
MGLFEQYPWLLVPIIIATVEGWAIVKASVREMIRRRNGDLRVDVPK